MQEHGSITTKEAFEELGCSRLAEYIRQIKTSHIIKSEWLTSKNRFGQKCRYKKYYLGE